MSKVEGSINGGIIPLLGSYVEGQGGSRVPVSDLCGTEKIIGLYFAATWCQACRYVILLGLGLKFIYF